MKVLIIDDWESRHERIRGIFRAAERPVEITSRFGPGHVTEEDLAGVEAVFLDHDMCQAGEGEPCPNPHTGAAPSHNMLDAGCGCPTGRNMVTRLIEREARPLCIVHTANPIGGRTMAEMLNEAGFRVVWSPVTTWTGVVPSGLLRAWGL